MKNTESILKNIQNLKKSASDEISNDSQKSDLEDWRIKYLGRNGELSSLMKIMKDISPDEKRIIGPKLNQLKNDLNHLFESFQLNNSQTQKYADNFDITLPGRNISHGTFASDNFDH